MNTIENLSHRALAGDNIALAELRARGILKSPTSSTATMPDHFPLSQAQKRLWFQCQFAGAAVAYNMPAAFLLTGPLDHSALTTAFNTLIQRHESLRTIFITNTQGLWQKILTTLDFQVNRLNLTTAPDPLATALHHAETEALTPFDLATGPLLRVSLLQLHQAPDQYLLLFNMHHIIADGWSLEILIREFSTLYQAFHQGQPNPLPPLRIQYKDYAVWQRQHLSDNGMIPHQHYWQHKLAGKIPTLDLPTDYPRPPVPTFNGASAHFSFSLTQTHRLQQLAQTQGVTLFMLLLALVKILLSRYTGNNDIIIGTPAAGRDQLDLEHQIGFYVNTLALRDEIDTAHSFRHFLQQVRHTVTQAVAHQAYPFDQLVEELNLQRDLARSPLFTVMLALHHHQLTFSLESVRVTPLELKFPVSKFDLTYHFSLPADQLTLAIEYRTDLFCAARIQNMGTHLQELLHSILHHPESPLSHLNILPANERHHILSVLNNTTAAYPDQMTIVSLFASAAARFPDRIAVTFNEANITYRELNAHANQLAHYLRNSCGVSPDERIAVLLDRHPNLIASLIGILQAGGVYVPLDPNYPEDRLRYLIADCGCRIIVTQPPYLERSAATNNIVINIQDLPEPTTTTTPSLTPDHAAYVIYTSGSTGPPKGCVITHRNVVRLLFNDHLPFTFTPDDVWLVAHSFCFDFSVWEMYGALLYGGRLVIATTDQTKDPEALLNLIRNQRTTVLNQTPAAFYNLIDAEINRPSHNLDHHLRYVIFGGDKLHPAYLKPWAALYPLTRIKLVNMYGITETTVHVTYGPLSETDIYEGRGRSPIGVPLPETRVYVCDPFLNLQPIGIPGELLVAGSGVCRGYLNRESLTRERFLPDPFHPGQRLYRTGDIGRWRFDSTLEYFGRNDHQIQIRGFRVEPGEIEARLATHPTVEKAVVIALPGHQETLELVAYIVSPPNPPQPFNINSLRDHLRQTLPDYMLPNHILPLDQFPLTANNKVDRSALPPPVPVRPDLESRYAPPETSIEQRLSDIWCETLHLTQVGIHDNFFDLGGHSLTMIQLRSKLNATFNRDLTIVALFQYPTIRRLADYLTHTPEQIPDSPPSQERAAKRESLKNTVKRKKESRLTTRNRVI